MAEQLWQQAVAPVGSKYEGTALAELSAADLCDLVTQCARNQRLLRDVDLVHRHRARCAGKRRVAARAGRPRAVV